MTRVVVQRGQGAASSVQSRTSTNSSASAVPTPPPLPPHLPVSSVPSTPTLHRSSSSPPSVVSEEEHNESKGVDTLFCGEPSCSDANSSEVGKKAEDEECSGLPASFDKDGRQLYSKSRHSIASLNEGEEGCSMVQQHDDADAVNSGSLASLGGGIGPSGLEGELLRKRDEDIGSQKTLVDFQHEGIIEKGDECPLQVVHSKTDDIPFSEPPLQSSGACGLSAPLSAAEVGPATSPSVSSSMPTPSAVSIPPASRRGGWSGSSFSGGLRTVASSRRTSRNIRSSRSPPQNSRSSSPRSYAEGDGYNSADEQSPWAVGQTMYEDNDDRERQFEIEIRRSRGLEVRRMAEDGNCLFRAVADQVYGDPEMHSETRQMCIDYMEKERDHFSQFVTESFSAYCKRKRRDKVYGNNLEIQAMAEMYNRPIHIFCYSIEPKNIFQGSYQTDLPPIRLSYHRDNHYNSLVDPNRPTVGAGLGFGSLHGANIDRDQVKAAIKAQQDSQIDKALLAEGRYYSDLELTEQEMERMVIEASRAEFLAEEYGQQIGCIESSTSTAGTSNSHGDVPDRLLSDRQGNSTTSICAPSPASTALTSNMRTLLSMGFSYFRVVEACSIFGDDINDMLCYLLEAETGGLFEESLYRMKGKAAER